MSDSVNLPGVGNLAFVEGMYDDFLRDPSSVPAEWQAYFASMTGGEASPARVKPAFEYRSVFNPASATVSRPSAPAIEVTAPSPIGMSPEVAKATSLQDKVDQLIRVYRVGGHLIANIDPLGIPRKCPPELDPAYYGLTETDMDRTFSCETIHHQGSATLRQIVQILRNTYCRSIGVEYMHIEDFEIRRWLMARMERSENRVEISRKEQLRILTRLTDATVFEEFIRKKFVGAKSFSLEGSETLIPLLDMAIEKSGEQGVTEVVIGMAHRGRLNVLSNIMGKSAGEIFREFADADPDRYRGRGDVKYHKGYSNDWKTASKKNVHISLCFNPSHLEFVNPVTVGRVRAKQDRTGDKERLKGLALLIHGDAAFAGQGVSQETLNLSRLNAYHIGGTVHIIVNNQIGFTTSPHEARSTTYATDVAKMLPIPIFHVNGEDPEAVAQVVNLALDFRMQFQRDVVIDMYGYRRLGHNETDEPSFTQPELYKIIEKRKTVREGYLEFLLKLGGITPKDADRIAQKRSEIFEEQLSASKAADYEPPTPVPRSTWRGFLGGLDISVPDADTGVSREKLGSLLLSLTKVPEGFTPHPKIEKILAQRAKMASGELPLDWAAAEALAFGTLAADGTRIRMSGQDVGRGTFSHRHAVLHDYQNGTRYTPLQNISPTQGPVDLFNSPLSEVAVLGFEYGYSLDCPKGLVLWEAQFGDFSNVAQVIIDQFITSAEDKWRRLSGLVLLLPHGFEGQGPEHSSARLERFLNISAEDNIQVVVPSTPAQYFHLLRRQIVRPWRKPLVVMTPKSLLRHPDVVSPLSELESGTFKRIIPDASDKSADSINRILLCSGKIYYELLKKREALKRDDVAIIRLEQLYPLNRELLAKTLAHYVEGTPVFWVQEEPENMGAWHFLRVRFGENLFAKYPFAGLGRRPSASPATGSHSAHKQEQEQLLLQAFDS